MYLRQRADHFVIGSYKHEPLLVEPEDILDHAQAPEMPSVMEWVPEVFERAREAAADLVPSLRGLDLDRRVNGMFSYTPDGMPLLGESADVRGFWSAQAVWITHAGGVGKAVAEWMVHGEPEIDLEVARALLLDPALYARALGRPPDSAGFEQSAGWAILEPLCAANPSGRSIPPGSC